MAAEKKSLFSPHQQNLMKLRQIMADIEKVQEDFVFMTDDRGKEIHRELVRSEGAIRLAIINLKMLDQFGINKR